MSARAPLGLTVAGANPAGLEPIGLDELNALAALQTRIDRKYVVDVETAAAVLRGLPADTRVLDIDGRRNFGYDSVYFDTPGRASYLSAAHPRRRRFKVRTRGYLDTGTAFLEVKTEGARAATVKERIPYDPADRSRLTGEGRAYVAAELAQAGGSAADAATQAADGGLVPALETSYRRTTFFIPGAGSRATLDEAVGWRLPSRPLWSLAGHVVLETKSGSSPGPVDRLLWAHGVRPARISKYATGLAALIPALPSNRWSRTLRRHLVPNLVERVPAPHTPPHFPEERTS